MSAPSPGDILAFFPEDAHPARVRLVVVLCLVGLAGCAAPPSTDPASEATVADGPLISGSLEGVDQLMAGSYAPPPRHADARATRDPGAPPVTRDGAPSFALSVLVRETWTLRDGSIRERHPCGGVVIATRPLWPDPRPHFDAFVWESEATVVDATGRSWTTERYVTKANASTAIWVQNLGGGSEFRPDDGAHCGATMYEHGPLNALLHIPEAEEVEVWYRPDARPARVEAPAPALTPADDPGPSPS